VRELGAVKNKAAAAASQKRTIAMLYFCENAAMDENMATL